MGFQWRNLLLLLLDSTNVVGLLYTYRIHGRFTAGDSWHSSKIIREDEKNVVFI